MEQKTILKIHCAKHPHRELELSDLSFIRVKKKNGFNESGLYVEPCEDCRQEAEDMKQAIIHKMMDMEKCYENFIY